VYEKQYKIKQIYYSNYSQELKKGHENYWWIISNIAEWIGNTLESSRQRAGMQTVWNSTIGVAQAKEKFGEVRVYCYLALPSAVEREYQQEVEKIKKRNLEYHNWVITKKCPSYKEKEYKSGAYPIKIPELCEFTQECYLRDLKYYRQVYLDAFKLWPQYEAAIRGGADMIEYLFESEEEIEEYFDSILENNLSWYRKSSVWTKVGEENMIFTNESRREKVKEICCFLNEGMEVSCQKRD